MATKDYDAIIRKAIQSGNYAVDTPKSVLREMFPDLAQWRLDRLGMENLSSDTQNYINSPFSTIKDTAYTNPIIGDFLGATLNYTGADTTVIDSVIKAVDKFEAGSISEENNNPGNIQYTKRIKDLYGDKVTKGKSYIDAEGKTRYHAKFADLDTGKVAQREVVEKNWREAGQDPVAFTKRYTGSPDPEVIKNYSNEIQKNIESIPVDQESNSIMKRTNELGAEILDRTNFLPNIQPTVSQLMNPKETEDIGEEWKRIENMSFEEFLEFSNVPTSSVPTATQTDDSVLDWDVLQNMSPEQFDQYTETGLLPEEIGSATIPDNFLQPQRERSAPFGQPLKLGSTEPINPIVTQANTPLSNVSTGNTSLQGQAVDAGLGRDSGNFISANVLDELQNISSVPSGTMSASDPSSTPNPWRQQLNQSQNMNLDTMDEVQRSIVERAMRSGQPAQVPTGVMADAVSSDVTASTSTGLLDKLGGAENVLGASMMAGGNLLAMNQYGDAISDVQEGLGEIPGMISETLTDAQRETDNVRNYLNTNIESTADASNAKLQASLKNLASNRNQSVGNIKNKTNEIRMNLQQGIDNTIEQAGNRFALQSDRIQESKRASMDAIESMKVELEAKKQELEKEKKQAMIGTGVAVGSLLADSVLPGSGQVLRSGWNVYSSNT